jgi:hypothetical protein
MKEKNESLEEKAARKIAELDKKIEKTQDEKVFWEIILELAGQSVKELKPNTIAFFNKVYSEKKETVEWMIDSGSDLEKAQGKLIKKVAEKY